MPGKRKTHLKVSPFRRILSVPVVVLSTLAGLGPFLDIEAYNRTLFDPIRAIAPLECWGFSWLTAAVFGGIAAARGHWAPYTAANVLVATLSMVWFGTLVYGKWWNGEPMTPTAFGLWAFPFLYSVIVTAVPADIAKVPSHHVQRGR